MLRSKLCAIFLLMCFVKVCQLSGNYSIGFEGYAGNRNRPNPTKPPGSYHTNRPSPRPNPTQGPSSPRPKPTQKPNPTVGPPKPNPTYRPSSQKPNPTYRQPAPKPNPTHRPSSPRPNPTYHPSSQKPSTTYRPPAPKLNTTFGPSKPNPTYRPPPNPSYRPPPRTTPRPLTQRTTPKPVSMPKPTSPPLWNIWTSANVPQQQAQLPPNNFKKDATLLGLYTLMRNVVGVTMSQTGQTRPAKKPLYDNYPYYYAVYHHNKDREKVSGKITVPFDSVGYCDLGTSDRTCVPGTYALCLLDWSIMCVTYSTATFPCHFNTSLQCASGKVPCDTRDPICASLGNQVEVHTPCISNVVVTSPSVIMGSITQSTTPDPYANLLSGPVDLCATTILEMKKMESPVGALVGFLNELEKVQLDFINNFNITHYGTTLPPVTVLL